MKSDFFRRPTRMTHKFGETEKLNDPLNTSTFEPPRPVMITDTQDIRGQTKREVQQYGDHDMFSPPHSPVQKPNGVFASINGPAPDHAEHLAAPVPVSTKKRKDHLATDK